MDTLLAGHQESADPNKKADDKKCQEDIGPSDSPLSKPERHGEIEEVD